jgi:hypothetical protein
LNKASEFNVAKIFMALGLNLINSIFHTMSLILRVAKIIDIAPELPCISCNPKMENIMRLIFILNILLICFGASAYADQKFYGSWLDSGTGLQLDILDGFKPNTGPTLVIEKDGKVSSSSWVVKDNKFEISIGYNSFEGSISNDGSLVLAKSYGDPMVFTALSTNEESASVSLKDDETAFISKLQDFVWLTSDDGANTTFKATFGTDTGVVEILNDEKLNNLKSWSVSSGVIKIDSSVIIEARVTDQYFVGLDQNDKFIVYKSIQPAAEQVTTDVELQRAQFFDALLTGEWETKKSWGGTLTHKFRPVYGELAGKLFTVDESRLSSDSSWEYSPATGALKVDYTEYVGALVVNETLALIQKNGDQKFYNRLRNGNTKRYTLGDVKIISLSENSLPKVKETLSPQFQRGEYLYSFEFKDDGRTGFTHMWRSTPFSITGETFKTELIGTSETLFQVEDFVVFEGDETFKMDTSESRLRPKTDDEVAGDVAKQIELQTNAQTKTVKVRMLTSVGDTVDIVLPVSSFSEIMSISIITE